MENKNIKTVASVITHGHLDKRNGYDIMMYTPLSMTCNLISMY